jgi:hypothetical protein
MHRICQPLHSLDRSVGRSLLRADLIGGSACCAAQTVQPKLEPSHQVQVASLKKLYELNRLEMLMKESKKLAAIDV